MKRTILFNILLLANVALFGQTGDFDFPSKGSAWELFVSKELRIARKLQLSTEQLQQLDDINNKYVSKIAAIKNDNHLNWAARRQQQKAVDKERDALFSSILTPEQLSKWKKMLNRKKVYKYK